MAATVTVDYNSLGGIIVEDTAVTNTAVGNPTGMSSGGTLYYVEVDNTVNTGAAIYFKIFDHAAPTIGTTEPEIVLKIAAGQRQYMIVPGGYPLNTAASYAAMAVASNSAASPTAPSSAVTIRCVVTNS
jgi:hypothetical protein